MWSNPLERGEGASHSGSSRHSTFEFKKIKNIKKRESERVGLGKMVDEVNVGFAPSWVHIKITTKLFKKRERNDMPLAAVGAGDTMEEPSIMSAWGVDSQMGKIDNKQGNKQDGYRE